MSRHECSECGRETVTGDSRSGADPPTLYCVHDANAIEMEVADATFSVSDYLNG